MLLESIQRKCLCEYVGNVLICCDIGRLNGFSIYQVTDVMVAISNMLGAVMRGPVGGKEERGLVIDIDWSG